MLFKLRYNRGIMKNMDLKVPIICKALSFELAGDIQVDVGLFGKEGTMVG